MSQAMPQDRSEGLQGDTPASHSVHQQPSQLNAQPTSRSTTSRHPYCSRPLDSLTPLIPVEPLLDQHRRKGRKFWENPSDPDVSQSYGDPVIQKTSSSTRFLFQNVKGLSTSSGKEDYRYYLDCLQTLQVDIAGLAETNTCWQHPHLCDDFLSTSRRTYRQSKVAFGSPSHSVDPIPANESFQAGGTLTLLQGGLVSRISGPDIQDPSGLGRWSGVTLSGKYYQHLTIITAYRVCSGSIRTASLGSAFAREHPSDAVLIEPEQTR